MLEKLCVKNFALIDELEIDFKKGLNILTGETGAGKSIVIGSLGFVLGGKADKDMIKHGCDSTEVTAIITIDNEEVDNALKQLDIDTEDGIVILKRTFTTAGKSACRINGSPATVSMMRAASALLVDIHGQHDHQSLLNPKKHIELLDKLCGDELDQLLNELQPLLTQYRAAAKKLKALNSNDADTKSIIELYKFQSDEIHSANLKPGEDEKLAEKRNIIANGVKLKQLSEEALNYLYRSETANASDSISMAINAIEGIVRLDSSNASVLDELCEVSAALENIIDKIRDYNENIETDTEELDIIESRLDLIYDLKKKYGATIEDINNYCIKIDEKLNFILNSEEIMLKLNKQLKELKNKILLICKKITDLRSKKSRAIGEQVTEILHELSMPDGKFVIDIQPKEQFDGSGIDNVEFLISANKGENPKPLSKIASGGEMSRVMLAMKVVLADADNISTFIFDEIDTGISGRAAQKVGEKMAQIAVNHQILCITHLPQIAAMSDNHYLIEKIIKNSNTATTIVELSEEKVYNEIARLTGGAEITEVTLSAAKEMRKQAEELKRSFVQK